MTHWERCSARRRVTEATDDEVTLSCQRCGDEELLPRCPAVTTRGKRCTGPVFDDGPTCLNHEGEFDWTRAPWTGPTSPTLDAYAAMEGELGRAPTHEELSQRLGRTVSQGYARVLRHRVRNRNTNVTNP